MEEREEAYTPKGCVASTHRDRRVVVPEVAFVALEALDHLDAAVGVGLEDERIPL